MSEVFDFTRMKPPSDAFNIKHEGIKVYFKIKKPTY